MDTNISWFFRAVRSAGRLFEPLQQKSDGAAFMVMLLLQRIPKKSGCFFKSVANAGYQNLSIRPAHQPQHVPTVGAFNAKVVLCGKSTFDQRPPGRRPVHALCRRCVPEMRTERLYYDSDAVEAEAIVLDCFPASVAGSDEEVFAVLLNRTILHPQGGGQPADRGWLQLCSTDAAETPSEIIELRLDQENNVMHLTRVKFEVGDKVRVTLDQDVRKEHARLHTGGHLIADIGEQRFKLKCARAIHFPGNAVVSFQSEGSSPPLTIEELQSAVDETLKTHGKVEREVTFENGVRLLHYPGVMPKAPCGGTHVKRISDLAGLKVLTCKTKRGNRVFTYGFS